MHRQRCHDRLGGGGAACARHDRYARREPPCALAAGGDSRRRESCDVSAFQHIGVLGAGAWGSALANIAARAGRRITLWARDPRVTETIARWRESPKLPGMRLENLVTVTGSIDDVLDAAALLVAVPSQAMRSVASALAPLLHQRTPVIVCAKGIERRTRRFMTEVVAECVPQAEPAILSGPSFATDVARGLPTAVTLAAQDEALAGPPSAPPRPPTIRPHPPA